MGCSFDVDGVGLFGDTSGQDSKWTSTVGNYIQAAEIVTLQEAGPTPPGRFQGTIPVPGLPQVGRAGYIQHHRWVYRFADYEVYFLQTDRMGGRYEGGRSNVAVVTHRTPDEVTAVPSPIADGRAALGVRFDDDQPRHIENMQSGGTLEALGGGTLNGMPARPHQPAQRRVRPALGPRIQRDRSRPHPAPQGQVPQQPAGPPGPRQAPHVRLRNEQPPTLAAALVRQRAVPDPQHPARTLPGRGHVDQPA